ncbi:hybrid sensor histidine kinase/response regulator [Moraxella osloensis]|uniref:Chemotaxis protein CheA n=1 Tax=Faucicola osloensis TaxID=34062 RepID=A0A378Q8I8_FAUOS|nr:Hpt domain-containing protein [Moraxella osloensis]AME01366.1 hybrid sensor histidine kinase/response regulator [Moraxella osloensis]OBX55190.1 hybrid sensor histidine kinase/response regulator [Moraxella osloensis]STY96498.1 Chemotaxis protein CheA [Moraxella osloensis]
MSKQRNLIALDWLMPVLKDVFSELNQLLQRHNAPPAWQLIGQHLHQITGALALANQPALSKLAKTLDKTTIAIQQETLSPQYFSQISHAVRLLQFDIEQVQAKQQIHTDWVNDRIAYFEQLLGIASSYEPIQAAADNTLLFLSQLATPDIKHSWDSAQADDLLKVWRYTSLQLLQNETNDSKHLDILTKVAGYLSQAAINPAWRQFWQLVAVWCNNLTLNEQPAPTAYATLLNSLSLVLTHDLTLTPDITVSRLAVDVLLALNALTHKSHDAKALLSSLDINSSDTLDNLFSQVLEKLEKIIYQVHEPLTILPLLESVKNSLANRGWVFYENQMAQIIDDVRLMTQDTLMASSLTWQVERQLQDFYSQLLSTVETLDSQIGLQHFAYASNPQNEALRQTRVHVENIKRSFNQYIQTRDLNKLTVNDELIATIQVFGALGLTRPKELVEQIRLLFSRIHKNSVHVLSWEASDAIADMIARFELFLDYLSNQSVNEEFLDQTQTQLNRANLLLNRLIETPLTAAEVVAPTKHFGKDTVIYDDEGERIASDIKSPAQVLATAAEAPNTQTPVVQESQALAAARQALKDDDYSMDEDIRDIFIEEAQEVLAELGEKIPVWEVDTHELVALKGIRRGFHTLKGSGRMVGAHQIGEMCWAVENMLNRVLDGTLAVSDALVGFIKDTHRKLPILVEDFQQQRAPSIDPAVTVLQATNLLQQQPINTGLPETNGLDNLVSVSDKVAEDSDNMAQGNEVTSDTAPSTTGDIHALPEVVAREYEQLTTVTDAVSDPDIQEIYIEEANEVIETIAPLNQAWQANPDDFDTLKEIRRGFHTLKGSGRMVGANQLGELAWSIENMLNRVLDHTIAVDEGVLRLVSDVIEAFAGLITIFAQNRTAYPAVIQFWQAVANSYAKKHGDSFSYHQALSAFAGQAAASPTASHTDAALSSSHATAQTQALQDVSGISDISEMDIADDVFIEEADELLADIDNFITHHLGEPATHVPDAILRAFHTLRGGAALIELNNVYRLSAAVEQALGDLLHNEIPLTASQLLTLQEAKDLLQTYIDEHKIHHDVTMVEDNTDIVADLIERLTDANTESYESTKLTVKDLIALGIDDLLDADQQAQARFAGESEQVIAYAQQLEQQASRLAQATDGLSYFIIPSTLQFAYKKIADYPQFAKNEAIYDALMGVHNQLINMFDAIAAGLRVNINEEAIETLRKLLAKSQYQAEMDAIEYQPVATDDELLQIFLDEVQTIQPDVQNYYNQWLNNLSNLEVVKELANYMHILKGGAELIGVSSIVEMALRGEQVYNAIDKGILPSDTDTASLLQKLHETIASQIKQVRQFSRSFEATDFAQQIDEVIAGTVQIRDLVFAVPLIVEANPEESIEQKQSAKEGDSALAKNDPLYIEEIINNFEERRLETWKGQEPDEDILKVYLEEAKELIDSSSQHLQEFRSNNSDLAALQALQRELHTIKGGARMVGAEGIATLAHEMETIYEELGSRRKPATRMIGNLLAVCHDWLASAIYVLENKFNPQTPVALVAALQQFSRKPDSLKEIPNANLASQIEQIDIYRSSLGQDTLEVKQRDLSVMPLMTGNFESEQDQSSLNAETLRISASTMDRMINLSGESAINRSRIEMGISSLSNNIEEMGTTVQRLADQLRRMETELEIQILSQIGDEHALESDFDPLEMDQYSALNQLSKSLSESASDLLDIKTTMLDKTRETENLLLQLSRTQTDLQEGLMDSRTVPFSRITPRLQRIVRQTATELGKSVELRILNDEGEIDRNILERITSPLEHMLRNAVDHGIEKSQERIESGKSRTGLITLEVLREGGEIVINLTDDGRGINVNAVRQKAIEQGLISAKDTSLKTLDIMQYIFNAGLSTAKSVSQISGRGVGMDVVQSEVKQLGGVVTVDSESGRGSRFTMRLPLTVAVSDALMVRAGDKYFAVPLVQIERVMRVNVDAIANFYTTNADSITIDGQAYRLRYLNQILYGSDPVDALAHQSSSVPVIIIRTDLGQRMALQVDMIAGSRIEVVVKPLGRQLSHIDGISAATIMGDGSVMLILDLVALMRNVSNIAKVEQQKANKSVKQAHKPVVLIVDDSVTVRKVTSRLLERNGYEAQVATDGIDALERLQEMLPEVIVLDIEMPRMDGFEVANHIRHNPRLKHIPIVMITSRTGEKHRERAFGIGVNEYMGKPFQEQMLLDTLARFTQQAKTD